MRGLDTYTNTWMSEVEEVEIGMMVYQYRYLIEPEWEKNVPFRVYCFRQGMLLYPLF